MTEKMGKPPFLFVLLLLVAVVTAIFLLLRPVGGGLPSINSSLWVKEPLECQKMCELQSGKSCESLMLICTRAGAESLQSCSDYIEQNPQALDNYSCIYSIGQTSDAASGYPCSFSCR